MTAEGAEPAATPPADSPGLLHAFLDPIVARHGERVAVDVPPGPDRPGRTTWTYAELDRAANAVAARLTTVVHRECVVGILLPRDTPLLYAAQIGVLRAGGAFVCLDPKFPAERRRFLLTDSRAVALLAGGGVLATDAGIPVIDVGSVVRGDPPGPPRPPPWLTPRSLAYVIYTSGTTGVPKGVQVEHRAIASLIAADLAHFDIGAADRCVQGSSPAYDSSLEETWLALSAGAALVVMDDDAARLGPDLVPWLRRERVTVLCPPPTLLRTTGCEDPAAALPELRLLYVGGEELTPDVADRWARGRRLVNGYGPTECTVTALRADVVPGGPVTIGRPVTGSHAFVLDPSGDEVAPGEPGELCIGGASLARGYLCRDALTADRFPAHTRLGRLYRTGDRARVNEDGEFEYLGRLDAQVKLRGHRIEPAEIEACLVRCDGVREAACRVQGNAAQSVLVAHVVPSDPLRPPDPASLAAALRASLPPHMVPARFAVTESLPRTAGDKLDRSALPEVAAPAGRQHAGQPPQGGVEERIAGAFAAVTGVARVSRDDDFFLDLGGESLRAARAVSMLRAHEETASLAVRDVYEARTVAALAQRAGRRPPPGASTTRLPSRRRNPAKATLAQCAALATALVAGSGVLYTLAFLLLPWLLRSFGLAGFLLLLPVLALALTTAWAPCAVIATRLATRALIGRYTATRAPAFGSFHARHWAVQQVAASIPWGLLSGTVFLNVALRALGARIGERVHIHRGVNLRMGGWDLLEIGADASIAQDAAVRIVDLDDGYIVTGPVTLGARSHVDVRAGVSAGASLGEDAVLTAHSWLRPGESIPDGERWDGVPARPAGPAGAPPACAGAREEVSPALHGVLTILTRFAFGAGVYLVAFALPALLAVAAFEVSTDALLAWLFAPTTGVRGLVAFLLLVIAGPPLGAVVAGIGTRVVGRVQPSVVSRFGTAYLRIALKSGVVQSVGELLSGTLYWPIWLRLAGMRVGRRCEVSTIIDVVPECVEIGDESFLADGVYLGGPRIRSGSVTIGRTRVGARDFAGNHAVLPPGAALPDDVLLGVSTVADGVRERPGTAWFGHPAMELPRRDVVAADRRLTHEPGALRFVTRVTWETARVVVPVIPALVLIGWFRAVVAAGAAGSPWLVALIVPAATFGALLAPCAVVLAAKWLLLGRVRPGQHPLWSCWCSRWDFHYVLWRFLARPVLARLEGTLLLAWYLRAMGMRVGRRVLLGGGFAQVVDPDMLSIGDDATVASLFQAHTFEDRVLKIDRVALGRSAALGSGSLLFYGVTADELARVEPHAVVTKGERLGPGSTFSGAPAAPAPGP